MPHGLSEWRDFLVQKPLPILEQTQDEVTGLVKQSQLSITRYALPIMSDAGFSAFVFRHVNGQRVDAGRAPLTTLDNALSHLGQGAFENLLTRAPLLASLSLSEKNRLGYIRTLGQACHGALQARDWAQQRNVMQPEEAQQATLLQFIGELLLWCYGESVMPEIEHLHYVDRLGYEKATENVLGCGMRQLAASIADRWQLPEMAIQALRSGQDNFTLSSGVALAAELARIVSSNWYGKQAQGIIQRIANYKGSSAGEIEHRLHINAVQITPTMLEKSYDVPARLLPMQGDDQFIDPCYIFNKDTRPSAPQAVGSTEKISQPGPQKKTEKRRLDAQRETTAPAPRRAAQSSAAVKPKAVTTRPVGGQKQKSAAPEKPVESAAKATEKNQALAAAVREFQSMVKQARPAHDLIEHMVKTCLLCGPQRCVFLVKVPARQVLVSRFSAQQREDIAIENLKINMTKPNLFSLLMEKSRNLFLNQSNQARYWKSIPDSVKLAIGVKQFFAMSVFVNGHAMGLMYVDKLKGELTQGEFVQFQGLCRLLSKGIVQSAHNKGHVEKNS